MGTSVKSKASGTKRRKRTRKAGNAPPKVSRTRQPSDLTLEEWQRVLRRQFGREQAFELKNLGTDPIFSEFRVTNPQRRTSYRVTIRGARIGESACTCPDFRTNALGTCKHIEFTLAKLARRRGGKAALAAGFQPPFSSVVLRYGAQRAVHFVPGTECPAAITTRARRLFDVDGVLSPRSFDKLDSFLAACAAAGHDVRCDDDVLGFIAEVRDAAERERIIADAFPRGIRDRAWKRLLKAELYDYQREGALFAATAGRAIIGDEMGLGKTVQAIAAAEIMARHLGVERVLIICPTSLKYQWAREIQRFSGKTPTVIGGDRVRRRDGFRSDVLYRITNYDTVHRDLDLIAEMSPDLVILDEAQRIKNWETRAARSVKRIESPHAIVLTGTPLENRLEELVSIVEFVDQHRLGPTFRFLREHQVRDESGRVVGYCGLDRIGRTLEPILIRRRKRDVLTQLPPRLGKRLFVPMTAYQTRLHEEQAEIVARVVQRWRRTGYLSEADRQRLMIALQRMRMCCDSSYLLDPESEHGTKPDEIVDLLADLLEEPGAKAIVFSQWLRMHELLQRRLEERRIGHVLFHGSLTAHERGELVRRFHDDETCRVFLSTDAGGVGLNLQCASIVVNADMPWNPAILEQRIGRAHRMGQRRPVQVIDVVAQGGIEQGMLDVLKFKSSLFAGALDGGAPEITLGGSKLKRFMETVERATAAMVPVEAEPEPEMESATETRPEDEAGAESKQERAKSSSRAGAVPDARQGRTAQSHDAIDPATTTTGVSGRSDSGMADAWQSLASSGLALLEDLTSAIANEQRGAGGGAGGSKSVKNGRRGGHTASTFVRRDPSTGEPYVHLPLPDPKTAERVVTTLSQLLALLRPRADD